MLWVAYLLGAGLTLLFKWARWCYQGKRANKTIGASTLEWFFEPSLPNATSWVTTIGCVWLLGAAYVDGIMGEIPLPQHEAVAFVLGSLMEVTAPAVAKWIIGKVPGA